MKAQASILAVLVSTAVHAAEPEKLQRMTVPPPPWPQGDERGMANQIGPATYARCAWHLQQPREEAGEEGEQ